MKRIEVTFSEAFLPRVALALAGMAPPGTGKTLDVSSVVLIVPGRRAARRVLELLAEHTQEARQFLVPPRVCTPQRFCGAVCDACGLGDTASEYEQHAAWMRALDAHPDALARILGRDRNSHAGPALLFSLAQTLGGVYAALAGERVTCADVARTVFAPGDAEYDRWCALDELTSAMRGELAVHGTRTSYDAVEEALTIVRDDPSRALPGVKHIVAAGLVDQFKQFSDWLAASAERVAVMTYGAGGGVWFDEYGALKQDAAFGVLDEHADAIVCCDSAAAQAHAAVTWLRSVGAGHAPTDVVIGVPDPEVIRPLGAALAAEGVAAHDAVGAAFGESSLGVLLTTLLECIEERTWEPALQLLRHPVIEAHLCRALPDGPRTAGAYAQMLASLETYLASHVVQQLAHERPAAADDDTEIDVGLLLDALLALLEPFESSAPLFDWIGPLNACLERLYDADSADTAALELDALRAWSAFSAALQDARVRPEGAVSAPVALRQFLMLLSAAALAPPRTGPAVDLVGWLELALDDAPVIAVTGMNEGRLSESVTSDAFLPDGLRARLGLPHNERRLLRDRYIVRTITGTGKKVLLTAGRAANAGDPLRISRVLCDLTAAQQAALLLRFYPNEEARKAAAAAHECMPAQSGEPIVIAPPSDLNLTLAITRLSATDFKRYLACPYAFYLRQTLGEAPPPLAHELDPLQFGTLLHDTLEAFGRRGPAASVNVQEITAWLCTALTRIAERRYGAAPGLALQFQLESCRLRLEACAEVHAARVRDGWRIVAAEHASRHALTVAGVPVTARIDRIDQRGSEVQILDYKTGAAQDPVTASYQRGAWVDLQLPLYVHSVAASGAYKGCTLAAGYFNVPSSTDKCEIITAAWTHDDLAAALATAEEVVRTMTAHAPGTFQRTQDRAVCASCEYCHLCQRV